MESTKERIIKPKTYPGRKELVVETNLTTLPDDEKLKIMEFLSQRLGEALSLLISDG